MFSFACIYKLQPVKCVGNAWRGARFLHVYLFIWLWGFGGPYKYITYLKNEDIIFTWVWRTGQDPLGRHKAKEDFSLQGVCEAWVVNSPVKPGEFSGRYQEIRETWVQSSEGEHSTWKGWSLPCFISPAGCECPWTPEITYSQKVARQL